MTCNRHRTKKRISGAVLLTVTLLIYLFLAVGTVQVAYGFSQTIYVNVNNLGDPEENGSQDHPFDQIQEGINVAVSGDTILVAPGFYYEEVVLSKNKSGISLIGGDGVIIDGEFRRSGIRIGFQMKPDYLTDVTVAGFTVRNCVKGINLIRCRNVRLRNNTMVGNVHNFADYSLGVNDVDTSNTVDGKPIYYWVAEHDRQIPPDAGFVALIDSKAITVKDLTLTGNGQGVLLKNTTSSRIENVSVINNQDGVCFDVASTNNTVVTNSILNNTVTGIYMSASSRNVIRDNMISGSYYGVYLTTASGECADNLIVGNAVQNHWKGIVLEGQANLPIVQNAFWNNIVSDVSIGISMYLSASNLVYHNNFINVDHIESNESQNSFDYDGQGNYWNDYNGTDADFDGIGDVPYVISEEDKDNYPLMGIFRSSSLLWEGTAYVVETISSSSVSSLDFSQQEKLMSFDLVAVINETGFCGVTLPEALLGGPYQVLFGDEQISILNQKSNGTHSFLYCEYPSNSGHVEVLGETVVPEFSVSFVLLLIFVMSFAASLGSRLLKYSRRTQNVPT
jgi:parallel beta-helix repeat protein